jgi:hypothetical protein
MGRTDHLPISLFVKRELVTGIHRLNSERKPHWFAEFGFFGAGSPFPCGD